MLTQSDFSQIKSIIEDVVSEKLQPINKRFDREVKPLKKQISKVQKDIKIIINYFENNSRDHEKRISKIENQIGISHSL